MGALTTGILGIRAPLQGASCELSLPGVRFQRTPRLLSGDAFSVYSTFGLQLYYCLLLLSGKYFSRRNIGSDQINLQVFFAYFEKSVGAIEFCLLVRGCGFVKPHPQKTTFNLERKNNMEGCASKYRYSTLNVKSSGLPF